MCRLAMVLAAMCAAVIPSAGDCPATCECKWKSGKESVLCEARNLTTVPQHIDPGTQLLDMSNNNLTAIRQDEFASAQLVNLQKVFLSRCSLQSLHRHAFHNLINLVDLDLSYNLLSSVPTHTFEFIPLLTELKLNGNPILTVRNNSFRNVPHLNKLDLSECRITYLEVNAFAGLEISLEWLKLHRNRFTNIRGDSVMILGNLKGLELAGNAWNCSCNLRPLRDWMLKRNIPQTISPVCRQPDRLVGRHWDKLQLDDFACLPRVLPGEPLISGYEGGNITLSCVVKSIPVSAVKWLRRERVISNSSGHNSHYFSIQVWKSGSNLTITAAELTDSGEYTCRAENRAGRAETRINLSVSVKPQQATWSTRVVLATAAVIILFSLAAVLLLICVCCLWRKQQRFHHRHISAAAATTDSYEMKNHKIPNSYEKVGGYGTEVKIDEPKADGRETRNGYISASAESDPYLVRGAKEPRGDVPWRMVGGAVSPPGASPARSPDLHIPAVPDFRYSNDGGIRKELRLSPASELVISSPVVKTHLMRKERDHTLSSLYTSCRDVDNFPDLLETDKSTLPRRGCRPRRTRTGSFGSESLSPLLTGSSDESCDGTPMPLLDFPDPYPELDKFLKEYRNLQEQLYKMKESCENLKQDNLRFKSEHGGEPKTISRLMDEVYKGGEVEPMYSVYSSSTTATEAYNTSQNLLNDHMGNMLHTPNNKPPEKANLNDDYWLTKGELLTKLSESNPHPTKSFYES